MNECYKHASVQGRGPQGPGVAGRLLLQTGRCGRTGAQGRHWKSHKNIQVTIIPSSSWYPGIRSTQTLFVSTVRILFWQIILLFWTNLLLLWSLDLKYTFVSINYLNAKSCLNTSSSLIHKAPLRIWGKFWKFSLMKYTQFYYIKLQFLLLLLSLNYNNRQKMKKQAMIVWEEQNILLLIH